MLFWTALIIGATLFGSGRTDYRKALWWATAMTLAGSLAWVLTLPVGTLSTAVIYLILLNLTVS